MELAIRITMRQYRNTTRTKFLDRHILYIHKMNCGILREGNSYPQLEVSYNIEWRSTNFAFRYDVMLSHMVNKKAYSDYLKTYFKLLRMRHAGD